MKVESELNGVDPDEVEVETEDGSDEKENNVARHSREKCVEPDSVLVNVVCPFALKKKEWAKD
jgi:hypothetical protein